MEEMEEYYMVRERYILNRLTETKKRLLAARTYKEWLLYTPEVKNNPERVELFEKNCRRYFNWAYEELELLLPMILDNSDEVKRGFIEYCKAKK